MKIKNEDQLFDYLTGIKQKSSTKGKSLVIGNRQKNSIIKNLMSCELLDEPIIMSKVETWFRLYFDCTLMHLARENFKLLEDIDLSFYKIFLLCRIRGELTEDNFKSTLLKIRETPFLPFIQKVALHKSFSEDYALIVFFGLKNI